MILKIRKAQLLDVFPLTDVKVSPTAPVTVMEDVPVDNQVVHWTSIRRLEGEAAAAWAPFAPTTIPAIRSADVATQDTARRMRPEAREPRDGITLTVGVENTSIRVMAGG